MSVARRVAPLKNSTWVMEPVVLAVRATVAGAVKVVAGTERAIVGRAETVIVVAAVVMVPLARAVTE